MGKKEIRITIDYDGFMQICDASSLEINILKRLGIPLMQESFQPLQDIKRTRIKRLTVNPDLTLPLFDLMEMHDRFIRRNNKNTLIQDARDGISFYIFKKLIFKRLIEDCKLCGRMCGKVHYSKCPVFFKNSVFQHYLHLGEEREIGKTLVLEISGCNMDCIFCDRHELMKNENGLLLGKALWREIEKEYLYGAFDSISFLGGNPDQSLSSVIDFLSIEPDWAEKIPIVWHTNGYSSPNLLNLINGLVDIWVFDFKYFSDACAHKLSNVTDYVEYAKKGLKAICEMDKAVPIIVRHLLLPGHWECCQKPLMDWLSKFKSQCFFNPMNQLIINEHTGEKLFPATTIKSEEYEKVMDYAKKLKLRITGSRLQFKK